MRVLKIVFLELYLQRQSVFMEGLKNTAVYKKNDSFLIDH